MPVLRILNLSFHFQIFRCVQASKSASLVVVLRAMAKLCAGKIDLSPVTASLCVQAFNQVHEGYMSGVRQGLEAYRYLAREDDMAVG